MYTRQRKEGYTVCRRHPLLQIPLILTLCVSVSFALLEILVSKSLIGDVWDRYSHVPSSSPQESPPYSSDPGERTLAKPAPETNDPMV